MRPLFLLHPLARVLLLPLLALAIPSPGCAQSLPPGLPELGPEARERLSAAAKDTLLPPWQRDVMLEVAGRQRNAGPDAVAKPARPGLLESTMDTRDGWWADLVFSERHGSSVVYDPVRGRLIVFGGYSGLDLSRNDVWTLSLAGTPVWVRLTPTGTPPSVRYDHRAIYDPVRARMVMFGGRNDNDYMNDAWALLLADPPAWVELKPTGPPPGVRAYHSAIYDPIRDRMVVFGGTDGSQPIPTYYNDVWALSLGGAPAWTEERPTGTAPSARRRHSAIYDAVRDRMVVFGGDDASPMSHQDVWTLSLAGTPAWTELMPTGTPPFVRYEHGAIYDPVRDRMVVFGGQGGPGLLNDVWTLSLANLPVWTQLAPTGTPPSARETNSTTYDPVRDRMVMFGGFDGRVRSDVWALSLAGTPAWTELTPAGTPPSWRYFPGAIYDPTRVRMVVFGGRGYPDNLNDVWALPLAGTPVWTELTPTGPPPSGRAYHGTIYDPAGDRLIVFAGYDGSNCLNDLWALSLGGTPAWTELAPAGPAPSARLGASAVRDAVRNRMVVFGGSHVVSGAIDYYFDDVWLLSLQGTPTWMALAPLGIPPHGRDGQSAVYDPIRDRIVVFGGAYHEDSTYHYLNDLWMLNRPGFPGGSIP